MPERYCQGEDCPLCKLDYYTAEDGRRMVRVVCAPGEIILFDMCISTITLREAFNMTPCVARPIYERSD